MAQYVNLEGVHPVSQIKLHLSFSWTKETVYINNNLMTLEQSQKLLVLQSLLGHKQKESTWDPQCSKKKKL